MKSTSMLREQMNGKKFKNNRNEIVMVINVHEYGAGHQVSFSYGAPHSVFCGLGKFLKRYPTQVSEDV